MGCQEENPICQDTQHQQPRPRQALGDKGPLLSSVEPGTGIQPLPLATVSSEWAVRSRG